MFPSYTHHPSKAGLPVVRSVRIPGTRGPEQQNADFTIAIEMFILQFLSYQFLSDNTDLLGNIDIIYGKYRETYSPRRLQGFPCFLQIFTIPVRTIGRSQEKCYNFLAGIRQRQHYLCRPWTCYFIEGG